MSCNETFRNVLLGSVYLTQYCIYTIPYSICMIVIYRQPLISNSAYKLMFGMGCIDLYALTLGSLISGLLSIVGIPYCPNGEMYWEKVLGAMGAGSWTGYCAICTSLALNRCVDTYYPDCWFRFFSGRKAWCWVLGSIAYGAAFTVLFCTPYASANYHAGLGLWIPTKQPLTIPSITLNNFLTPIAITSLYASMVSKLWRKARPAQMRRNVDRLMRRVMLTTTLICFLTTSVALAYIIVPLSTEAPAAFLATNIFWQACHGFNCLIYIAVNDSIREKAIELLATGCLGVSGVEAKPPTASLELSPVPEAVELNGQIEAHQDDAACDDVYL